MSVPNPKLLSASSDVAAEPFFSRYLMKNHRAFNIHPFYASSEIGTYRSAWHNG